jgi:hypothetical protein
LGSIHPTPASQASQNASSSYLISDTPRLPHGTWIPVMKKSDSTQWPAVLPTEK